MQFCVQYLVVSIYGVYSTPVPGVRMQQYITDETETGKTWVKLSKNKTREGTLPNRKPDI